MYKNRVRYFLSISLNLMIALILIVSMGFGGIQKASALGDPRILTRANEDRIVGFDWAVGSTITIEIDDPLTGPNPDKTVYATGGTAPWNPNEEWFETSVDNYDLKPGDIVTMSNVTFSKQLTIENLFITEFDLDTEVVHGTADPSQLLYIQACDDSTCAIREETADQDGNWTANFAVPGEGVSEQDTADLRGGIWLDANINDGDGDMSRFGFSIPNPAINVLVNTDRVGGNAWPLGELLEVEIDDPATPQLNPDFETTTTPEVADWNPFETWFEIGLDGYDLKTGDVVTITGGGFSKQLTIQTLAIAEVNLNTDTVYGIAEPDQEVEVVTCYSICINQNTTADQDGNWSSSFDPNENDSANIRGGSWVAVVVHDTDGDTTRFGYGIPNPSFGVRANEDRVEGWQWPLGATVNVEIDDPTTTLLNPDYSESTSVGVADWNPNETWFNIEFAGTYDIKVGDLVTVTDGTTTKQHTVVNLNFTQIETDTDRVFGTTDSNQLVNIWTCWESDPCINRDETADQNGVWMTDFSIPGEQDWEQDTADLRVGSWIDSSVNDEDGDSTMYGVTVEATQCQPGNTISGAVFEHDGLTPIVNAAIQIEDFSTGDILFTSNTDQNGQFGCSLPNGDYRINAFLDGYSAEYYIEAAQETAAELQITTGTQLTNINFTISPLPAVEHLTFNLQNPLLQDLAVRQAIAFGTDRQRILNEAFLPNNIFGTVLNSIIPTEHWASAPASELEIYPFNPAQARSILESAGWADSDNDGFRENAQNVELAFTFKSTQASFRVASAEIFRQNMEAIGIRILVETIPAGIFFAPDGPLNQGDFDIAEFAWAGDTDNEPYLAEYRSTSPDNFSRYNNPAYDAAIANARAETSDAGKLPYLFDAQAMLTQDLPILPLFTRLNTIYQPRFHVQMVENNVEGYEWPADFPVTLTIDDPDNGVGVDFTDTQPVIPFDEDPTFGWVPFNDLGEIDLAPGLLITMTNGMITKTHTVTDVTVTGVDIAADTVSGIGTPGANLNVQYCDESGCLWRRWATIQPDGTWNADFSVTGPGSDEQLILDIVPGIIGEALEPDGDADHTDYLWEAVAPQCQPGNTISGTVFKHDGMTPIPNITIQFEDFNTGLILFTSSTNQNGQFGCSLPDGDYRVLAFDNNSYYTREYFNEARDTNAALLQVTGGAQFDNVNFTLSPLPIMEHLTFNLTNPLLQEPSVRQAIFFGTNRQEILSEAFLPYNLFGMVSNSIVPPEHWAAAPAAELTLYPYNPIQAGAILDAADWINRDADIYRENASGVELAFTFKTTEAPFRVVSAELFRQQMEQIGIRVTVETLPPSVFFGPAGTVAQGNFDIAEFAWGNSYDDETFLEPYVTGHTDNYSGYSNPAFDAVMANAASASTEAEKLTYYYEAQSILSEDLPIVPYFTRQNVAPVTTPTGSNVTVSPETYLDVHFDQVTDGGVTTVLPMDINPDDLPPNFQLLGQVYDVGTSASFTSAQICFSYNDAGLTAAQEDAIQLLHLENNTWVDVTDAGYPDTTNNVVCGTVTSFSPFAVMIPQDATPPTITWLGNIDDGDSFYYGFVPAEPTCTADDPSGVDGACAVTGYSSAVGPHTLTATARDTVGNVGTEYRSYSVLPWRLQGFYQPVDMNNIYNTVKGGSTVPLKFELFAGSNELTDPAYLKSLTYVIVTCNASTPTDEIESTITESTGLCYDPDTGQFIYNWKTPKNPGVCYRLTLTTDDGSTLVAFFKLK
ncbi:MAG: ABC transporter substrate-binding protein [Chloroflexota bacterium]